MKRDLIKIMASSHGLDYAISGNAVEQYVNPRPGTYHDGHPDRLAELAEQGTRRRRDLVRELRDLARALEAGEPPFAIYGAVDPDAARGSAEREMDELGAHIKRLQARASKPADPLAGLVVTVGCEAVHPDPSRGFLHEAERRGGQHVAKPCTGVRIRHVPTGLEVMVQSERSQHANRRRAASQLLTTLTGREDEGIVPHDAVISQLMEWGERTEPKS